MLVWGETVAGRVPGVTRSRDSFMSAGSEGAARVSVSALNRGCSAGTRLASEDGDPPP